jgi:acetoin utilization deacetylase AcuC-like enzyme
MKLSDDDMAVRDRAVLDLVTKFRVSTVVLYGGGYNRDRVHTARLHANTIKLAEGSWRQKQSRVAKSFALKFEPQVCSVSSDCRRM